MPLGREVGVGSGDIVLDGTHLPPKGGKGVTQRDSFLFGPYVYCGQTARWIKIPLGTEVGLGAGNI